MRFLDLFAGLGGFRLALESQHAECVYSCEKDPNVRQTYFLNFRTWPGRDITEVDPMSIPEHDLICAGFPCQPFSISGNRLGFADSRGTLFYDILRIAKHHKTKYLILENVRNLKSHDNGRTFKLICQELQKLGYKVHAQVLNASQYGVPTARQRIFIVATLDGTKYKFPTPSNQVTCLEDYLETGEKLTKHVINTEDIKWRSPVGFPHNKPIQLGLVGKGGQGERIYSTEGHAVTFSAHGGGRASKTGAYVTAQGIRKLSPREAFRVMGFPENYVLPKNDAHAYTQIGNSVAVPVVAAVHKQLLKCVKI